LTQPLAGGADVVVDRLPRLFGQLEANWATGLSLPHGGTIHGVAVRSNILTLDGNNVAAAQLAVDRQIEHGEVARSR
jgi:hypothetical protein